MIDNVDIRINIRIHIPKSILFQQILGRHELPGQGWMAGKLSRMTELFGKKLQFIENVSHELMNCTQRPTW